MEIFWLPSETPIEFSVPLHRTNARLALYWSGETDLIVLFPKRGEESCFQAAITAFPRRLAKRPLYTGIADLVTQTRIDWRSYRHGFTTPPDIQHKMSRALFGL